MSANAFVNAWSLAGERHVTMQGRDFAVFQPKLNSFYCRAAQRSSKPQLCLNAYRPVFLFTHRLHTIIWYLGIGPRPAR